MFQTSKRCDAPFGNWRTVRNFHLLGHQGEARKKDRREGKGREGKGSEGKGREGKESRNEVRNL